MAAKEPVRLLILDSSQNSAEESIVLLRNAGKATRAHQVESEPELIAALKEQTWDLCLANATVNDLTAEKAIQLIKKMEKDIPFILLAEDNDLQSITDGLLMGADDVALDDDKRLALIIDRELTNLENRRSRRRAQVTLRETERRCQLLLDSSMVAIAYVHEGMHIYANQSYLTLFGFDEMEDLEGVPVIDLVAEEDQDQFKALLRSFEDDAVEEEELTCVDCEGSRLMTHISLSSANYDDELCTQVIFRSVTEDSELADRLKELGSQDLLTGLYNRQYFVEQLERVVDHAVEGGQNCVIFYMSLDGFAEIKTEAGIANADLVLGDIAAVIKRQVEDEHLLARFGDDVFTMVYKGDEAAAEKLGQTICKTVEEHLSEVAGKTFHLSVSIGLALITENSPNAAELISRAHRASAYSEEGTAVHSYQLEEGVNSDAEDGEESSDSAIVSLIEKSIEANTLKLLFQPIISLHSENDEQFEVLLRLIDDDDNELVPAAFLDQAHEAGLAEKMDRWVILQSMKLLSVHRSEGSEARIFINVTHETIMDDTFLPWVSVALKAARLPSDAIIFQIHESDAATYLKQAKKFTEGLAELHCKTSINHFGCSLNPFKTLKFLSVDYVKLDGSFAQQIEDSEDKRSDLIDMVKSLQSQGVLTAISGVESPVALSTLWEAGLNFIQGNYLSFPLENMQYEFTSDDM
jgi:diguanylate cyclase (GGDEF)-like protein/PAS domain S-box-containing protein|tara:strand:- start:10237 stop:12318 length:2082 start_codon:yes stop_codon:yes gene_type:complete